jgi:hypothetical protein
MVQKEAVTGIVLLLSTKVFHKGKQKPLHFTILWFFHISNNMCMDIITSMIVVNDLD